MIRILGSIIFQDMRLALWRGGEGWQWLAFFAVCATLFPLALGSEPGLLKTIAPGVVWVLALLSILLSLPMLFARDHADGTLEQYLLLPAAFEWIVLAKCVAQWLVAALPLILLTPLVGMMYYLPWETTRALMLSLLIGTPALIALGAFGAALTLSNARAGAILALLVLPLCVPVLIFGAAYIARPEPLLLGLSLALTPICAYLSAVIIRHSIA